MRFVLKRFFTLLLVLFFCSPIYSTTATPNPNLTDFPWAVMAYAGRMTNQDIAPVMDFDFTLNPERLYSLEFSHQLDTGNPVRLFFQPAVTTVEVAANFTYRKDPGAGGSIYEFIPYFDLRWANFPWKKYLLTSVAMGEGVSYVSQIPAIELQESDQDFSKSRRLLNYLMFEATFALPSHPQLELVWRIHHRSGAFGLYNAENSGSTAVGVGIRYRF